MKNPAFIIIAAACGFCIASAFSKRPSVRLESKAPEPTSAMPDNIFEVRSLTMAAENARQMLNERREQIRLWQARAKGKALMLPPPEERKN